MPLEIRRTARANRDLHDIWAFVARDNPRAADDLIRRLNGSLTALSSNPHMGRPRTDLLEGLKSFPNGRYVIFFRHDTKTLTLVRVLSGYRELGPEFFE
jgi:toxin ParE1/3/4